MKKSIILCLITLMISTSWGDTAYFGIAADDVKSFYYPSDIITIELVADFPVGQIGIDYVYGEHTASDPQLHTRLTEVTPVSHGDVINSGGVLIQSIAGGVAFMDIPAGEVLWSFEYHFQEVLPSTIYTISAGGVILADLSSTHYVEEIEPFEIHTPEPTTTALLGLGGLLIRRRK